MLLGTHTAKIGQASYLVLAERQGSMIYHHRFSLNGRNRLSPFEPPAEAADIIRYVTETGTHWTPTATIPNGQN